MVDPPLLPKITAIHHEWKRRFSVFLRFLRFSVISVISAKPRLPINPDFTIQNDEKQTSSTSRDALTS